jgi:hypothetical protein
MGEQPHARISAGPARPICLLPSMALDACCGQDHPLLLPTGAAIGRGQLAARETNEVPVGARTRRGDELQRWLAAWFAALLAIAPFARPSLPVDVAAVSGASPEALIAHDDAQAKQPATGLRPAQPVALGILSRLSLLETTLGLPPVKPPLLRPAIDQPVPAAQVTTALGGEPRGVFQRSSVGTARTQTGPPS